MVSILDWKKDWRLLYFEVVKDEEVLSLGFRNVLIVAKSDFGLLEPEWMRFEQ